MFAQFAGAQAQTYPNRPVRMVAGEAGGAGDFGARIIVQALPASFGQPVIIENRGGTVQPLEIVAKASADGHTLLYYGASLWLLPFMREHVSWDPIRDFAPITLAVSAPNMIVAHPSFAAGTVKELIALAKSKPGALNYASGISGSSSHLAAELFKAMAGVDIVRITYKGIGPALNDVIGGQVPLSFANVSAAMPHVKSGKLKLLAITSAQPSVLVPSAPTVAASGLPGYESASIFCIFAPARTPRPVMARLNQEFVRVLNQPEVKQRFVSTGVETVGSSPDELAARIKSEMTRLGKVIRDAGIRE
jgi:tripartite-type tricarboxylate transporter receptor subunit TctC